MERRKMTSLQRKSWWWWWWVTTKAVVAMSWSERANQAVPQYFKGVEMLTAARINDWFTMCYKQQQQHFKNMLSSFFFNINHFKRRTEQLRQLNCSSVGLLYTRDQFVEPFTFLSCVFIFCCCCCCCCFDQTAKLRPRVLEAFAQTLKWLSMVLRKARCARPKVLSWWRW